MIINIFSNFDPIWFNLCYKNSIIIIIPILIITNSFWYKTNKLFIIYIPFISYITTQLIKTKIKYLKNISILRKSLFILIIYINILGMLPYIFRSTSHIILTISLALPIWFILIIRRFTHRSKKTIGHLLPDNAPILLNPFLVLIESIRIIIRPLTLRFRLAANITAGHVVISLISLFSIRSKIKPFILIIILSIRYILFEIIICIIQAYIFCLLISLYRNDHP